jgi:hypothetical protein
MTNLLTLFLGHHDADCICLRHPAMDVFLLPEAEGRRQSRHTFSCDDSAGGRRNGGFFDSGNEPRPTPNPKPKTQTGLLRTGRFFFSTRVHPKLFSANSQSPK